MEYQRVFTAADGQTHFGTVAVALAPGEYVPGVPLVDLAAPVPVTALIFSRLGAGYASEWHPPPRRQFVADFTGTMELTVSDGDVRRFGPGSLFCVEDLIGQGHQTRAVGDGEVAFATMPVPADEATAP